MGVDKINFKGLNDKEYKVKLNLPSYLSMSNMQKKLMT